MSAAPVEPPIGRRTPATRKARQLATTLRSQRPDYAYLKEVFRQLRAELGIVVPRTPQAQLSFIARGHTADSDTSTAYGVASILVQAALLAGFVLLVTRRFQLSFGSLTVVFTLNAILVSS